MMRSSILVPSVVFLLHTDYRYILIFTVVELIKSILSEYLYHCYDRQPAGMIREAIISVQQYQPQTIKS